MLTDDALFAACGVRVAFTGRAGGVSQGPYASLNLADFVGDDPACVQRNLQRVQQALGAEGAPFVAVNQVHGADIVRVCSVEDGAAAARTRPDADALVVDVPGVAAMIGVGDCLPLAIVAPSGRFALVHVGWRGAVAGIAGKAVRALSGDGAAEDPAGFNAYIGPHIGPECFEVGADVAERFRDAYGEEALAGPRHVSLSAAVTADLARVGMDPARIVDARICTICRNDEYFSYRASGGTCGRQAVVAFRR